MAFTITDGRITSIDALIDPERLDQLGLTTNNQTSPTYDRDLIGLVGGAAITKSVGFHRFRQYRSGT